MSGGATHARSSLHEPLLMSTSSHKMMRSSKLVLATITAIAVVHSLTRSMLGPFIRSLVQCEDASFEPRDSPLWSGSAHCGSKETVLSTALRTESTLLSVQLAAGIVVGPMLGSAADRYGRKLIILIGIGLQCCASALLLWAALQADRTPRPYGPVEATVLQMLPLFLSAVCEGAATTQGPLVALLTDLTPPEMRTATFSTQMVMQFTAGGFSSAISIVVLRLFLESYATVYGLLSLAAPLPALALLLVHESTGAAVAAEASRGLLFELRELVGNFWTLFASSSFLRSLALSSALIASGIVGPLTLVNPMLMAIYDWPQGNFQILAAVTVLPTAVVAILLSVRFVVPTVGSSGAIVLASAFTCSGSLLLVLLPWSVSLVVAAFFLLGFGIAKFPAINALVAEVFRPNELARAQALIHLFSTAALSLALPGFAYAYDAHARGLRAAAPLAAGASLVFAGVGVLLYALCPDGTLRGVLLRAARGGAPLTEAEACAIADAARGGRGGPKVSTVKEGGRLALPAPIRALLAQIDRRRGHRAGVEVLV